MTQVTKYVNYIQDGGRGIERTGKMDAERSVSGDYTRTVFALGIKTAGLV